MGKKEGAKRPPPLKRSATAPATTRCDDQSPGTPRSRRRRWRLVHTGQPASPQGMLVSAATDQGGATGDDQGSPSHDITEASVAPEQGDWDQVATELEVHDEKLVKKWNEQIDSLLVFAGLFSAVTTSFNVESYKNLQLDAAEASQVLLVTISQQLTDIARGSQSIDPSHTAQAALAQLAAFKPRTQDVWVNGLWFSSLVCSLIAASLGILVKQWLQRYKTEDYSPPRERTRIRQHRFGGLLTWGVPAIVALLPLLLRTSLNLFFIGLIVFLGTLHRPTAIGISILIAMWFLAYILSLILPSISDTCPYKSPEATFFYVIRRIREDGLKKTITQLVFISWNDGEERVKRNSEKDVETLATVDRTFADRALDSIVRGCLKDLRIDQAIKCVKRIISDRLHTKVAQMSRWTSLDASRITKRGAISLVNILVDTLERLLTRLSSLAIVMEDYTVEWMGEALQCATYLLRGIDWGSEETPFDERLAKVTLALLEVFARWEIKSEDSLATHLMSLFCTRPALLQKCFIPMIPQLLYISVPIMIPSNLGNRAASVSPVKMCTALLSLVSLVDADSFEKLGVEGFLSVAERVFDYYKLPPGVSHSVRAELLRDVMFSREKAVEIDAKKPGVGEGLIRALDDCLADIAPPKEVSRPGNPHRKSI